VTLARLGDPRPLPVPTKLALYLEVVVVYIRARVTLRRRDVRSALALLRGTGVDRPGAQVAYAAGARLGQLVTRVLGSLPGDSRCLMMSVVLSTMLARRGVESSIVVGVKSGTAFGAHAWVELEGRPILPPEDWEFERFVAL